MEDQKNPASRRPPKSGVLVGVNSRHANQTVVIPDTPDRVCKPHRHVAKGLRVTSAASSSKNLEIVGPSTLGKPGHFLVDSRHNAGVLYCCSDNSSGFGNNQVADSSVVSSSVYKNAAASRTDDGKIFMDEGRHKEAGRVFHSRLSGGTHHHRRSGSSVPFEHGEFAKSSHMVARKEPGVETAKKALHLGNVGGRTAESWVKHSGDDSKGKSKVDHDMPISSDALIVQGHDTKHNVGKCGSVPLHTTRPPNTNRRIVLVRNGCISPHNTAKAKQLAESSVNDHAAAKNALPNGSHHVIDVDKVTAKETTAARAKGKGIVFHPCLPENQEDRRDVVCLADERGKRKIQGTECRLGQGNTNISNNTLLGKGSSSEPVVVLNEGQFFTPSTSRKRQKKHESESRGPHTEAEVICLSSCGESSRSKSTLNHGSPSRRAIGSPIVIGELSPEVRDNESQSEARALQVQADEMLARELQEQMYNEIVEAPADEGVLALIREQQQQEANNTQRASRVAHRSDVTRAIPVQPRRQSQSQSLRSRLFRRGAQARIPTSNASRFRSRIHRYPWGRLGLRNTLSPSDIAFPSDMDMDMRVGLLEAMEAVARDDIRMVAQLLDSDREFNENDYEMLLALDENNHRHLGASVTQISNLPESIVQNDSSEACSICLENPTIGDTIRHLPCLHKFHKDCIDPWLRRKRSCPVCKSDV